MANRLKTMLKVEKNSSNKCYWLNSVDDYNKVFNHQLQNISKDSRKNLLYNLKYLEYLQLQLDELVLDSVIEKMIWKNYIIIAYSVIELIFQEKAGTLDFGKKALDKVIKENSLDLTKEQIDIIQNNRKLRNRVHLLVKSEDVDTDWFAFNKEEYLTMKSMLFSILSSSKVSNTEYHKYIEFLK
ncbi:hypothetical protein AB1I63_00665 [Streptococcus pneumoniae]